jgi:acyl carrier protein
MTHEEILAKLTLVIGDVLDRSDIKLNRETVATEVPGWDSVSHIEIIVAAEIQFHIKFRTAELDEIKNVGDFVDMIARKMSK